MNFLANPFTFVIPGATGNLTSRKLIPALFRLFEDGNLPENFNIVGVARTPFTDDEWEARLFDFIPASPDSEELKHSKQPEHSKQPKSPNSPESASKTEKNRKKTWNEFRTHLLYFPGDAAKRETFTRLESFLKFVENEVPTPRVFYLATAPMLYHPILNAMAPGVATLEKNGIPTRIVVEKPFGSDLKTARELNRVLHGIFREEQIFRMDHFLGKETVQNLLVFRFANSIFEPIWNRNFIHDVQITAGEASLAGNRIEYYNQNGVLRDMIQNHLLQLLCLTAMEPPAAFAANAIRDEKVKVLQCIRPFSTPHEVESDTIRGRYVETDAQSVTKLEPKLEPKTSTFGAVRFEIENWRWLGVPFFLRSGKGMSCRSTQIILRFRRPPHLLFTGMKPGERGEILSELETDALLIQMQPAEGIQLYFQAKVPGTNLKLSQAAMNFSFAQTFPKRLPDAYERLLLDVLSGDSSLFARNDEVEEAWRLMDPIQNAWDAASETGKMPFSYEIGSWGPSEADEWIQKFGSCWFNLCPVLE